MKKLFIHHPLFRLLSPLFSGVVVYLLILLINNNVEQLQESFLGEELYVCIGLSFVIQELSRLLIVLFSRLQDRLPFFTALLIQIISSLALCIITVFIAINLYYKNVLGYTPNSEEIWPLTNIFCAVTFIYILLHISHQYLYKVNTKRLHDELLRKQLVEEDFLKFKNDINPDLLFDSLEAIIVLMKQQKTNVDDLIDHIAATYRYILSQNKRQLVLVNEELQVLDQLTQLFNYLPYRRLAIKNDVTSSFLIVPGSLLKLVEYIMRSSISSNKEPINIVLSETEVTLELCYVHNDKIVHGFNVSDCHALQKVYEIYSTEPITIEDLNDKRCISLPKLKVKS